MSKCNNECKLCDNFIISQAVNFSDNTLIIDLPNRAYGNNCKYCIVIAQTIPDSATISAPVVFSINGSTTTYPFVNCDYTPIYASQLKTRRIYKTCVNTAVNTGVFKYVGRCKLPCPTVTLNTTIPAPTTPTTPAQQ